MMRKYMFAALFAASLLFVCSCGKDDDNSIIDVPVAGGPLSFSTFVPVFDDDWTASTPTRIDEVEVDSTTAFVGRTILLNINNSDDYLKIRTSDETVLGVAIDSVEYDTGNVVKSALLTGNSEGEAVVEIYEPDGRSAKVVVTVIVEPIFTEPISSWECKDMSRRWVEIYGIDEAAHAEIAEEVLRENDEAKFCFYNVHNLLELVSYKIELYDSKGEKLVDDDGAWSNFYDDVSHIEWTIQYTDLQGRPGEINYGQEWRYMYMVKTIDKYRSQYPGSSIKLYTPMMPLSWSYPAITPEMLAKYGVDENGGCYNLAACGPVYYRHEVVGFGWAWEASQQILSDGTVSSEEYYTAETGQCPRNYYFESQTSLRVFTPTSFGASTYTASSASARLGNDFRSKITLNDGVDPLDYKQVLPVDESHVFIVDYVGKDASGKPKYVVSKYRRMAPDELQLMLAAAQ